MKIHSSLSAGVRAFVCSALFAFFWVGVAMGQTTADVDEIIVVTGQKIPRQQDDAQASLFTLSNSDIAEKELRNIRDAFRLAANVIDTDWVDSGFLIRGVNSEGLTPGGSPLATLYLDGSAQTVHGTRRGSRGLWDVERVEIYRGPQSTLAGRSSLAGAIHMFTRNPTFDWDGAAQVTAGIDDTQEIGLAFGGPIVEDTLAFRLSAEYQSRENDLDYPEYERYTGFDDFVTNEYHQLRGKLLFQPEAFNGGHVLLTFSTAHDSPNLDDIAGPGLGFEYSERRGDLNSGTPFFQEDRSSDNDNFVLDIGVPFSDDLMFSSITSLSTTDMERPSINFGTPGEVFVAQGDVRQDFATQEFRINGEGQMLRWVAGLYFSEETTDSDRTLSNFFSGGRFDTARSDSEVNSQAIFGEVEFDLDDRWTLVAGGRFHDEDTRDETFFSRDYTNPTFMDIVNDRPAFESDVSQFLPKIGAVLNIDENQSLGLTYSEGFRSGGAGINNSTGQTYSYAPEHLQNYELSYRRSFADDRVRLAANIFFGEWNDQQVEVQLDPADFSSRQVENAARSELSGLEVELNGSVSQSLSAFLSIGYSRTEFKSFDPNSLVDFSGLPFPQSPEWTITLGVDYENPNGVYFATDVNHVDEYFARDYQNAPLDTVGDYTLVNVRVGYRRDNWSISLFADNAADEEYFVYRDVIGTFDCCATLGKRRSVGIAGRWNVGQ